MGKSSSQKSTSNTIAEPWEGAQPFLRELLGGASGAYNAGQFDIPSYPGIRVAPQSTMTQTAQQQTYDTATGGNPYQQGAMGAYPGMVSGDVSADLSQLKQNVLADVVPAVSSRFSNAGMLDSSQAMDTISRSAAEAVAPIEYGAWENAQNRSLSALGMAPSLSASRYIDPQMLGASGGVLDQHNQQLINAAMGQWQEEGMRPYENLQRASSLGMGFGGLGGTSESSQQQPGPNPFTSILGAGLQTLPFFFLP